MDNLSEMDDERTDPGSIPAGLHLARKIFSFTMNRVHRSLMFECPRRWDRLLTCHAFDVILQ